MENFLRYYELLTISEKMIFILSLIAALYMAWQVIKDIGKENGFKPVRITWLVFTLLDTAILLPLIKSEASPRIIMLSAGYLAGAVIVFLLSIPFGRWVSDENINSGNISLFKRFKSEIILLLITATGLSFWFTLNDEVSSTLSFSGALIFGAYPLIKGIYKDPDSQPMLPWVLWFFAALINAVWVFKSKQLTSSDIIMTTTYLGLNVVTMIAFLPKIKRYYYALLLSRES